jgi:uncharacterized protein (DUF111 family)
MLVLVGAVVTLCLLLTTPAFATAPVTTGGGPWKTTAGRLTVAAPASHSNDGVHLVFCRSSDAAGNRGYAYFGNLRVR